MLVSEVMTRDVIGVAPEATADMVAELLADHGISGVPVLSADNRPLGLVTKSQLSEARPDGATARDIMKPEVVAIAPSATIVGATNTLLQTGVHHLLVVDEEHVVGIITTMDLVRGFARSAWLEGGRYEQAGAD